MNTTEDNIKNTTASAGTKPGRIGTVGRTSSRATHTMVAENNDVEPAKFWGREGLEAFDAEIFKDEDFTHEEWEQNSKIADAGRKFLKMKAGDDAEEIAKIDKMSDQEVAAEALNKMRWFNNNIVSTGRLISQMSDASDTQKVATLYLMDAYEHMSTDWSLSNIGRFAWQGILTDPSTIGSAVVGVFTFGAGGAATKAATTGATQVAKAGMITLTRQAVNKVVTKSLNKVVSKTAQQAIKKTYSKAVGTGYRKAITTAAIPGIIEGVAFDYADQSIRTGKLTYNGEDFLRQDGWNGIKTLTTVGAGAALGSAFGAGGHRIAKYFDAKKAAKTLDAQPDAKAIDANEVKADMKIVKGGEYQTNKGEGLKGKIIQFNENYKAHKQRMADDPHMQAASFNPFSRFKRNRQGQNNANAGGLPEFKREIDWRKTILRRNFQVSKLFTNWATLRNMRMRSRPVTRPVTRYMDRLFAGIPDNEIAKNRFVKTELFSKLKFFDDKVISQDSPLKIIQNLQETILNKLETGNPSNKSISQLIDDATRDQNTLNVLQDFSTKMDELYKHVDAEFKTVDEIKSTSEGLDFIRAGKYGRHGLEKDQKKALLEQIKEMKDVADDLQKGTQGNNGQRMLDIANEVTSGNRTIDKVRDDLGGISRANYLAGMSYTRLTAKWPGTDGKKLKDAKANWEWIDKAAREIDDGQPHNPHHQINMSKSKFKKQNAEAYWQNNFDLLYKSIGKISDEGVYSEINWNIESKKQFAGFLTRMYELGLGNEAFYIVKRLAFLRHGKGGADQPILPEFPFEGINNLPSDSAFKKWRTDLEEYMGDLNKLRAGAAKEGSYFEKNFGKNRINMHAYTTRDYPTEFAERYRGRNWIATPGRNFFYNWGKHKLQTSAAWLLGAHTSKVDLLPGTGKALRNISWRGVDAEGNAKKLTFGSGIGIARRSMSRIFSGGLINDLGGPKIKGVKLYFLPIPTTLGWTALSGGALYGAGYGLNEWGENLKESEGLLAKGTGYLLNAPGHTLEGLGLLTTNLSTYPARKEWQWILGNEDPGSIPFPEHEPEPRDLVERIVDASYSLKIGLDDAQYNKNKTSAPEKAAKYQDTVLAQLAMNAETALTDAQEEIKDELDTLAKQYEKLNTATAILKDPSTDQNIKLTHEEYLELSADLRNTSDDTVRDAKERAVDAAEETWKNAEKIKSDAQEDIEESKESIRRAKSRLLEIEKNLKAVREPIWSIIGNVQKHDSELKNVSYKALIAGTPNLRAIISQNEQSDLTVDAIISQLDKTGKIQTVQENAVISAVETQEQLFKNANAAITRLAALEKSGGDIKQEDMNAIKETLGKARTSLNEIAEADRTEEQKTLLKNINNYLSADGNNLTLKMADGAELNIIPLATGGNEHEETETLNLKDYFAKQSGAHSDDGSSWVPDVLKRPGEERGNQGWNGVLDAFTPEGETAGVRNFLSDSGVVLKDVFYRVKDATQNTFHKMKNSSGGRTALGIGGGLLGVWGGMALFNNFYNDSFLSKIPIVGSLIKLGVTVALFFGGWKLTEKLLQGDGVHTPHTPSNPATTPSENPYDVRTKNAYQSIQDTLDQTKEALKKVQDKRNELNAIKGEKSEAVKSQLASLDEAKETLKNNVKLLEKELNTNSAVMNMVNTAEQLKALGEDETNDELERALDQEETTLANQLAAFTRESESLLKDCKLETRADAAAKAKAAAEKEVQEETSGGDESSSTGGDDKSVSKTNKQASLNTLKDNKDSMGVVVAENKDIENETDEKLEVGYTGTKQGHGESAVQTVAIVNGQAVSLGTGHESTELYITGQGANGHVSLSHIANMTPTGLAQDGSEHTNKESRSLLDKKNDLTFNIEEVAYNAAEEQDFDIKTRTLGAAEINKVLEHKAGLEHGANIT